MRQISESASDRRETIPELKSNPDRQESVFRCILAKLAQDVRHMITQPVCHLLRMPSYRVSWGVRQEATLRFRQSVSA